MFVKIILILCWVINMSARFQMFQISVNTNLCMQMCAFVNIRLKAYEITLWLGMACRDAFKIYSTWVIDHGYVFTMIHILWYMDLMLWSYRSTVLWHEYLLNILVSMHFDVLRIISYYGSSMSRLGLVGILIHFSWIHVLSALNIY